MNWLHDHFSAVYKSRGIKCFNQSLQIQEQQIISQSPGKQGCVLEA